MIIIPGSSTDDDTVSIGIGYCRFFSGTVTAAPGVIYYLAAVIYGIDHAVGKTYITAIPVIIKDFDRHDAAVPGDSCHSNGVVGLSSNSATDVGPMSIAINRECTSDKIFADENPRSITEVRVTQYPALHRNPGIKHADFDQWAPGCEVPPFGTVDISVNGSSRRRLAGVV